MLGRGQLDARPVSPEGWPGTEGGDASDGLARLAESSVTRSRGQGTSRDSPRCSRRPPGEPGTLPTDRALRPPEPRGPSGDSRPCVDTAMRQTCGHGCQSHRHKMPLWEPHAHVVHQNVLPGSSSLSSPPATLRSPASGNGSGCRRRPCSCRWRSVLTPRWMIPPGTGCRTISRYSWNS